MHRITWSVLIAIVLGSLHGVELGRAQPIERALSEPSYRGGPSLWTVMAARRSAHAYGSRGLSEAEIGQLLWAGQGVLDNHRTTPSAGALYPLTIHVVDARGVWRYVPSEHGLVQEGARDRRAELAVAALGQNQVRDAAVTFVISGDVGLVASKYGPDSAERFVTLEAGHVAQNMLLAATALELAAAPIGAFDDRALRRVVALADHRKPLYLVAVGSWP